MHKSLKDTAKNNATAAMPQQKGSAVASKGTKMTLADRLKKVREDLKKSQKEISKMIDISYPAWQGYELGKNEPGSAVIEELVKLGYNANWILTGKGPMTTSSHALFSMLDGAISRKREVLLMSHICHYLSEYKKSDSDVSDDMAFDMSATLFAILYRKDDAWLTNDNINLVIKSLIYIYKAFDIFRKIDLNDEEIRSITAFIQDPEKWEFDTENNMLAAFSKFKDGLERSEDESAKKDS
ncbi:MAG: helix-turn-helix transcriptional regulator [Syntrophales bacterium]|nr:helix-turn-helix transcriptional regulator [Syntrophales bacterium]